MSIIRSGEAIKALDVPRLLVAAAQPYQTMAGPALTTNFLHQPQLLPFQRLPFYSTYTNSITSLYYHTLLSSLAEFAETPRPVRYTATKLLNPPLKDFWREVGVLNTLYCTNYLQPNRSAEHPSVGAVELSRGSHRGNSDVRMTLYSSDHVPLSSVLITGPRDDKVETNASSEGDMEDAGKPLDPIAIPVSQTEFYTPSHPSGDPVTAVPLDFLGGEVPSYGGLYGPLMELESGAGFAQRAFFGLKEVDEEAEGGLSYVVPPWMLFKVIADFHSGLIEKNYIKCGAYRNNEWFLCSQQIVLAEDVFFGESFDVVCAPPKYFNAYRIPPWKHELGLPHLRGDCPCSCLRLEVRQRRIVVCSGTFFFCPV